MRWTWRPPRARSLRAQLLWLLSWPLWTLLVVSAWFDYQQALHRAFDNQDLALGRIAIALASRFDVDADDAKDDDIALHLDATVAAIYQADRRDTLRYLVMDRRTGARIGGDPRLALLGQARADDTPSYVDRRLGHDDVRVVTYPHSSPMGPIVVLVAETTARRHAQARMVLRDTVVPNIVQLLLTLVLVWLGVRMAMRPLDALDAAVSARQPDDLSPLPTHDLPRELAPLADAMNRLMANLRQSAESQQTFLSNAAHQLRTPLAGVQTQLELARQTPPAALPARLDTIQAALTRMTRTTHQMLALARSGPLAAQAVLLETVSLPELLEEAASFWLDAALAARVDLGFELSPAQLRGSPWMLNEWLGNVLHNAIRHSPPGGCVTVACGTSAAGQAWLSVEDEGPGIPEAERDKVLERFYRAPGALPGGSGLGLAIVREVAQRHQAELSLGPGREGRGLRVQMRFPN